jgi:hypothetical protein
MTDGSMTNDRIYAPLLNCFKRLSLVFLLILIFFFDQCAHIERPPGGPADSTNPFITAVFPEPGALNQSRELKAVFEFSEWIKKDLRQNHIFISPALSRKLQYEVNGNLVYVTSHSKLDSNTTYILSVQGNISDLHNITLKEGFDLVFSTGNRIDSVWFSGRIVHEKKQSKNILTGLYPVGEIRKELGYLTEPGQKTPDSLPHPRGERPMYLVPSDSNGIFYYLGIRPGTYAVLAFEDKNMNLRPDIGIEELAIGSSSLRLLKSGFEGLRLAPYDTVAPTLVSAVWEGERLDTIPEGLLTHGIIQVKFSTGMDQENVLNKDNYLLLKSDSSDTIPILHSCFKPKSEEIELWTQPLYVDSPYILICRNGRDQFYNPINPDRNSTVVKPDKKVDSLEMRISPLSFKNGDSAVFLNEPFEFYTSKIITKEILDSLKDKIITRVDDEKIAVQFALKNHHTFLITLPRLPYKGQSVVIGKKIEIKADSGKTPDSTAEGNILPDSIRDTTAVQDSGKSKIQPLGKFKLADKSNWGQCRITQSRRNLAWTLVFKSTVTSKEMVKTIRALKRNTLDSIPEGSYLLSYYADDNGNGHWDAGRLKPWAAQEAAGVLPDTLVIEAGGLNTVNIEWPPMVSGRK